MTVKNILYRQRQRFKYHLSRNALDRRIAEINAYEEKIAEESQHFLVKAINLRIPRLGFDFLFEPQAFELLEKLSQRLNASYLMKEDGLYLVVDGIKIRITGINELFVINEVFFEQCYNFLLPGTEEIIVADMGMNVGIASLFFAKMTQVKAVCSFEPFKPTFDQAIRNFRNNSVLAAKIIPHNFGLGYREVTQDVSYFASNSGVNSTQQTNKVSEENSTETVSIKPAFEQLSALLEKFYGNPFVLKIDTEGAEYEILESLVSKGKMPDRIKGFMIEWHFQGPEPLIEKLIENRFMVTSFRISRNSGLIYAFR